MTGNYVTPDYGNYMNQWHDWLETTGLRDPADAYNPPAGPPIRIVSPVPHYPLDEAA
jgi:hypothetical protein